MKISQLSTSFFLISIILSIFITIYTSFYNAFVEDFCLDEFEHLQVSFNILNGLVPYRDFFEHHHGLLWYMGSFFLHPFFSQATVLYGARIIAIIIFFALLFSIYKLCRLFLLSKLSSILAPLLYANIISIQENAIDYRPDTLMTLFFMIGLYCFFKYVRQKQFYLLFLSFLMFFLSFASLQKILAPLIGVFFCIVYLIVHKQILFKDVLKALYIPFLLFITYLAYLYNTYSLRDYWESCWILNFHLHIPVAKKIYCVVPLAYIITIYFLLSKKFSKDIKLYSIIALTNLIIITTVFKLYNPQYEIQPYALFSVIFAVFLDYIIKHYSKSMVLLAVLLPLISSQVLYNALKKERALRLISNINLNKHIMTVSSPKDYIINNHYTGGTRLYATGYYWFEYFFASRIHQHLFPRRPYPNLELIIRARKPKVIIKDTHWPKCLSDDYIPTRHCTVTDKVELDALGNDYVDQGFIYVLRK